MINPSAECDPGYYCEFGMDRARPTGNDSCVLPGDQTGAGDICPLGSYCPLGTTLPLPCPAGSFSNETGLAVCHICPLDSTAWKVSKLTLCNKCINFDIIESTPQTNLFLAYLPSSVWLRIIKLKLQLWNKVWNNTNSFNKALCCICEKLTF